MQPQISVQLELHSRSDVTVGMPAKLSVEMIVRGYLCGSDGVPTKTVFVKFVLLKIPDGMKENQKFPQPIITLQQSRNRRTRCDISKEESSQKD